MTSYDDILDALIAQERVVEQRFSYSDLQRKLTEPADWPRKVCNFQ
jgi:hypothetical protein